ncbi:MAG: hypothetical protein ACP5TY_04805, partial [Thermodesulforhabdaceae bacterium]
FVTLFVFLALRIYIAEHEHHIFRPKSIEKIQILTLNIDFRYPVVKLFNSFSDSSNRKLPRNAIDVTDSGYLILWIHEPQRLSAVP